MRNGLFVGALAFGAMLSGLLTAGPVAAADGKKRVDQITCEEFLALDPDDQQRIAYWVDGYEEAKGEAAVGTVAFDKFGNPIGTLLEDCGVASKETLRQKRPISCPVDDERVNGVSAFFSSCWSSTFSSSPRSLREQRRSCNPSSTQSSWCRGSRSHPGALNQTVSPDGRLINV